MATLPALHATDRASEPLPPLAAHRVLAILAGDAAPAAEGDAADGVARFIIGQGWGRLAPSAPDAGPVCEPSPWFVRVTFPGIPPPDPFIVSLATAAGLRVQSLAQGPDRHDAGSSPSRWLLVAPQPRDAVSLALRRLQSAHRIHAVPFRKIEDR